MTRSTALHSQRHHPITSSLAMNPNNPSNHASDAATELRPARHAVDSDAETQLNPAFARQVGDSQEELRPGACLRNRYVLETMIGQGAMGQVWKAKDRLSEEAQDRNPYVAIKVMLSDFERQANSFAAMHREASRSQKLAHPNIVTVHTLDRDERTGRVFMAMELLDGEPLDSIIRIRNPQRRTTGELTRMQAAALHFTPKQLWAIVEGLAQGLAYAHRKHLVHSDFKPGNVFLTREGMPKVLDFGIARAARQGDGDTSHDQESVVSGYTESYASPEQIAGQAPHTADDVFALGLVAYELLSGRHPFDRRPASVALANGQVLEPIKELDRQQWRTLQKALAFKRADRWQHAGAFLEALQARTALQMTLASSVAVLLLTAAGLAYKNHLDNQPAVPFEQLPVAQQLAVQEALDNGNEALLLVRNSHLIEASADAADYFARAYAIHPRNARAVAGLEASAQYFIDYWQQQGDRQRALQELAKFQEKSEYYRGYRPLERALQR